MKKGHDIKEVVQKINNDVQYKKDYIVTSNALQINKSEKEYKGSPMRRPVAPYLRQPALTHCVLERKSVLLFRGFHILEEWTMLLQLQDWTALEK